MPASSYAMIFAAAIATGAINAVAGGGTLVSFPVLLLVGLDPKTASATNTMGIWPASLAGAVGFRSALTHPPPSLGWFAAVSAAGAFCGAALLKFTPPGRFAVIVPWLIMASALLFLAQEVILRHLRLPGETQPPQDSALPRRLPLVPLVFQFLVGVYGGYFGAGMGILMLGVLSAMRLGDIYQMNFLKSAGALLINVVAAVMLGVWGLVNWPVALAIGAGSALGGYGGASVARKIGPRALRAVVSIIGLAIAGYMLYSQFK